LVRWALAIIKFVQLKLFWNCKIEKIEYHQRQHFGNGYSFLLKNKGFEVALFEKSSAGIFKPLKLTITQSNTRRQFAEIAAVVRWYARSIWSGFSSGPANKKNTCLQNSKLKSLPDNNGENGDGRFFFSVGGLRLWKNLKSKSPENRSRAHETAFGTQIVERAADPFIAGIYAKSWKPEHQSGVSDLYELERDYGDLLVGSLRSKNQQLKFFPRVSFRNGTLTDKLAESLRAKQLKQIRKSGDRKNFRKGKWLVKTFGEDIFRHAFVISTPRSCREDW